MSELPPTPPQVATATSAKASASTDHRSTGRSVITMGTPLELWQLYASLLHGIAFQGAADQAEFFADGLLREARAIRQSIGQPAFAQGGGTDARRRLPFEGPEQIATVSMETPEVRTAVTDGKQTCSLGSVPPKDLGNLTADPPVVEKTSANNNACASSSSLQQALNAKTSPATASSTPNDRTRDASLEFDRHLSSPHSGDHLLRTGSGEQCKTLPDGAERMKDDNDDEAEVGESSGTSQQPDGDRPLVCGPTAGGEEPASLVEEGEIVSDCEDGICLDSSTTSSPSPSLMEKQDTLPAISPSGEREKEAPSSPTSTRGTDCESGGNTPTQQQDASAVHLSQGREEETPFSAPAGHGADIEMSEDSQELEEGELTPSPVDPFMESPAADSPVSAGVLDQQPSDYHSKKSHRTDESGASSSSSSRVHPAPPQSPVRQETMAEETSLIQKSGPWLGLPSVVASTIESDEETELIIDSDPSDQDWIEHCLGLGTQTQSVTVKEKAKTKDTCDLVTTIAHDLQQTYECHPDATPTSEQRDNLSLGEHNVRMAVASLDKAPIAVASLDDHVTPMTVATEKEEFGESVDMTSEESATMVSPEKHTLIDVDSHEEHVEPVAVELTGPLNVASLEQTETVDMTAMEEPPPPSPVPSNSAEISKEKKNWKRIKVASQVSSDEDSQQADPVKTSNCKNQKKKQTINKLNLQRYVSKRKLKKIVKKVKKMPRISLKTQKSTIKRKRGFLPTKNQSKRTSSVKLSVPSPRLLPTERVQVATTRQHEVVASQEGAKPPKVRQADIPVNSGSTTRKAKHVEVTATSPGAEMLEALAVSKPDNMISYTETNKKVNAAYFGENLNPFSAPTIHSPSAEPLSADFFATDFFAADFFAADPAATQSTLKPLSSCFLDHPPALVLEGGTTAAHSTASPVGPALKGTRIHPSLPFRSAAPTRYLGDDLETLAQQNTDIEKDDTCSGRQLRPKSILRVSSSHKKRNTRSVKFSESSLEKSGSESSPPCKRRRHSQQKAAGSTAVQSSSSQLVAGGSNAALLEEPLAVILENSMEAESEQHIE